MQLLTSKKPLSFWTVGVEMIVIGGCSAAEAQVNVNSRTLDEDAATVAGVLAMLADPNKDHPAEKPQCSTDIRRYVLWV